MIVAIMQPYFFPYIGYFQLLAASDLFVFYDDVQFIKGGWVNRNRVLVKGGAEWITYPIAHASYSLPINARHYLVGDKLATRMINRLRNAYRWAPHFDETMTLVEEVMAVKTSNVADFNIHLLRVIAAHLGIRTAAITASSLGPKDVSLGAEQVVVDMCRRLGATHYVNAEGGRSLYHRGAFETHGIDLAFLQCDAQPYAQFGEPFVPSLSIIDVLMFNTPQRIRQMLGQFQLLPALDKGEGRRE